MELPPLLEKLTLSPGTGLACASVIVAVAVLVEVPSGMIELAESSTTTLAARVGGGGRAGRGPAGDDRTRRYLQAIARPRRSGLFPCPTPARAGRIVGRRDRRGSGRRGARDQRGIGPVTVVGDRPNGVAAAAGEADAVARNRVGVRVRDRRSRRAGRGPVGDDRTRREQHDDARRPCWWRGPCWSRSRGGRSNSAIFASDSSPPALWSVSVPDARSRWPSCRSP